MCDSAGGGEGGGGTAGAGQEAEADSEPPLRPPSSLEGDGAELGSLLEEPAAFPCAKRLKMSDAIRAPLQPAEVKAQTDPLREEDSPRGAGNVSCAPFVGQKFRCADLFALYLVSLNLFSTYTSVICCLIFNALHYFIAGEEPLQSEEEGGQVVATAALGDEECCQNGNTAHESHPDEPETRPEEEQHNSNDSADSRSERQ